MKRSIKKFRLHPVQILALGFCVVILVGGCILSLPISSADGQYTDFLDSLFTSTSAVCVTGLITMDTGTYWSVFGQCVILLLIEIGGLGFMSLTTFIAVLLGKKITLRDRLVMQEAMNTFKIEGIIKMVQYVMSFTVIVQLAGAFILSTQFIPQFGIGKGIFYSIFHSVSAFCNAGFDLNGNFSSLTSYANNSIVLLTISLLIIIGGLGFTVALEIHNYKRRKKLSINSKIVLVVTATLIIMGTILMLYFEYKNPETIGMMNIKDKIVNAYFAAVTPRTAGFNSISTDGMTMAGKLLTIMLMFIGGSPGSTAGGLKTTTIGILVLTVICVLTGREDTEAFGRRFSKETVYKSFTIVFVGIMWVIGVTLFLTINEPEQSFINLFYEATSAFGTAGLSTGVTQEIGTFSKILLMISMYIGRVGPLTVLFAIINRKKRTGYKYPEGKILIG
ncbi:MAG: Trk family potassium uptake protein [Clostridium butyricum]|nr:Trk family potassium uptake protein [Clostridium butyricum]